MCLDSLSIISAMLTANLEENEEINDKETKYINLPFLGYFSY